jgi:F0F1-type ATP synthase membrane subunit b/b'
MNSGPFEEGIPPARSLETSRANFGRVAPGEQQPTKSGLSPRAAAAADHRLEESFKAELDLVRTQIHGLQEQFDALTARRDEAAAGRASRHVAAIVAAAERSAAKIRAAAEQDAATMRDRLLADVHAEVERIRSEAESDAARIRREGHAEAAQARQRAIDDVSAEVEAVCARLAEELQARARAASPRPAGSARMPTPPRVVAPQAIPVKPPPQASAAASKPTKRIADKVVDAVRELENAATALERSLRNSRATGD